MVDREQVIKCGFLELTLSDDRTALTDVHCVMTEREITFDQTFVMFVAVSFEIDRWR